MGINLFAGVHTATLVGNYILSMLYRGSCIILMMKLRIIMGDICSIDKGIVTDLLILLLYLKISAKNFGLLGACHKCRECRNVI